MISYSAREYEIRSIIQRYSTMVYRLAYARTRNHADAEDIYQEVFLKLATRAPEFEDEEHRKAWLLKVTANCSLSLLRSAWRRRVVASERLPELQARPDEGHEALKTALEGLSQADRTVLHLFYYEDMSVEEIAQIIGKRGGAVRSRLFRARERLKTRLEGSEDCE